MDIHCARCGTIAIPAGHEDARAFYQCENCNRVWMVHLTAATAGRTEAPATRVLIVDDAYSLVALVEAWLDHEGYAVATATSGRQALESVAANDPDIVLLDLIIPPPDGFMLCELLLRRPTPPQIIVMTGVTDATRLHDIDVAGVSAILHKPLNEDAVLDAVSRARRRAWAARDRPRVH
jgi:CheY-like chemotaxis protein